MRETIMETIIGILTVNQLVLMTLMYRANGRQQRLAESVERNSGHMWHLWQEFENYKKEQKEKTGSQRNFFLLASSVVIW